MKRRISLLLALVIVLGSFGTAFAAVPATAEEKAKFLKEKEILQGNNSDELMLDMKETRQNMVVMLSRLMQEEEVAKAHGVEEAAKFEDITDGLYRPYIAWSVAKGYTIGQSETKFGAKANVTAQEYSIVLLRALGYFNTQEPKVQYDNAFAAAKKLGLLEETGIEGEKDQITRKQMSVMIYNALGTKVEGEDKTLAQKLGIKMPAPEKLEAKVFADNLYEITVELNDAKLLKNVEAVKDARNYRTNAGEVVNVELKDNQIVLTLNKKMEQNRKYELTTRYISDLVLNKEVFTAFDNKAPEVVNVEVLGTKGIRVEMSEPVKKASEKNFKLDGKNFVMKVEQFGENKRDILLLPYDEDVTLPLGDHVLTIGQLEDFEGFKSEETRRDVKIEEKKEAPEVKNITVRNNEVIVEFEDYVFPKSVKASNVAWEQSLRGRKAIKADSATMLTGKKVKYTFTTTELPKPRVDLVIKDVENYSGIAMAEKTETVDVEIDFTRPEIINHRFEDNNKLEIEFNKDLLNAGTIKDNYELNKYNTKTQKYEVVKYSIDEVKFVEGRKNKVEVTFKNVLVEGAKYQLDIKLLRDNTVLQNTMIADYIEFTYGIATGLDVVSAKQYDNNERIMIKFNEKLKRQPAEDLANYEFKVGSVWMTAKELSNKAEIILHGNGYNLEISLPGNGRTVSEVRVGLGVQSLSGNRLESPVVKLNESHLDITEAVLDKDGETLTVTFNQDIELVAGKELNKENITVINANIKSAKIKDGKLVLTVTLEEEQEIEKVTVGKDSNIKGVEETAAPEEALTINKVTDKRPLAVVKIEEFKIKDGKANFVVKFNKALTDEEVKETEVFVNGEFVAAMKDAKTVTDKKEFKFENIEVDKSEDNKYEVKVLEKIKEFDAK